MHYFQYNVCHGSRVFKQGECLEEVMDKFQMSAEDWVVLLPYTIEVVTHEMSDPPVEAVAKDRKPKKKKK
jgi:hypothetical protein